MEFTWDEKKRLHTITDRKLDFLDVPSFFDWRDAVHQLSPRHGEDRWKTTVENESVHFTVVWLWRGDVRHIISMRRDHAKEIRGNRALHG